MAATVTKFPVSVQKLVTGNSDLDRVQNNIITPLNSTLTTLNAAATPNHYLPMGWLNQSVTAGVWTNLVVAAGLNAYYQNDEATSLVGSTFYVASTTAGNVVFRVVNVVTSQVLWTSETYAPNSVTNGADLTPNKYPFVESQPYVVQVSPITTGTVAVTAALKVAYL